MKKLLGYLVILICFGLPSNGLAQENVPDNQEQEKKEVVKPDIQNKTRFGVGFNKTLFSGYGPPDIGVRGVMTPGYYTIENRKELELRIINKSTGVNPSTGLSSGGNAYHVISWQEFYISDRENFISNADLENLSIEDRRTVVDNWVAFGRGMTLRYAYLDEVLKAKPLRYFVGPEIGIFFRHESLRFKGGQDRDNYRRGLSFGLRHGLNLLVTKNFLFYVEHSGRFNFVTDVEIANFKTGVVYIF